MPPISDRLRTIIVCADDYALAPGISRSIADLIKHGRVSATSCMTLSPFWPMHAVWLRDLSANADLGLHLTLTDHVPLGLMPLLAPGGHLPSLGRILNLALRGQLPEAEIKGEMNRQFDAFQDVFGRPPDFVDSHHHVHQFPLIRRWLLETLVHRSLMSKMWIRVCAESAIKVLRRRVDVWKTWSIGWFGFGLRRLLLKTGVAHNRGFTGIYDFSLNRPYESLLERFLIGAQEVTLLMCHPGTVDAELRSLDTLVEQREEEFRVLAGDKYFSLLNRQGLKPGRFSEILPSGEGSR